MNQGGKIYPKHNLGEKSNFGHFVLMISMYFYSTLNYFISNILKISKIEVSPGLIILKYFVALM